MSGWNDMEKAKKEGGGGLFIKIKDGKSVEGVFRGQPRTFYQRYGDRNEYPAWMKGLSFRFRINFITKDETGKMVAKIFQGGAPMRDMILDAKEEYGLDCVYKIKRTGSTKDDTRYAVLFKAVLTTAQLEMVNAVQLKDLKSSNKEQLVPNDEGAPPEHEFIDDIPF